MTVDPEDTRLSKAGMYRNVYVYVSMLEAGIFLTAVDMPTRGMRRGCCPLKAIVSDLASYE